MHDVAGKRWSKRTPHRFPTSAPGPSMTSRATEQTVRTAPVAGSPTEICRHEYTAADASPTPRSNRMGKLRHSPRVLAGTILVAAAAILLLVPAAGIPQTDAN